MNLLDMPIELLYYIITIGDLKNDPIALNNLTQTCKWLYYCIQLKRLTQKLLLHVAKGEQMPAGKILKLRPDLLIMRANVTDLAGRTFINVTAFELMLWNLDVRYMWGMMRDSIEQSNLSKEEKLNIQQNLLEQYNKVQASGVTYILGEKTYVESHYNFNPLLNAYKEQTEKYPNWAKNKNFPAIQKHWSSEIGTAQLLAPLHVLQHLCEHELSVAQISNFTRPEFNRTDLIYDYASLKNQSLEECIVEGNMGIKFAILRLNHATARCCYAVGGNMQADSEVLTKLVAVRMDDLVSIKYHFTGEIPDFTKQKMNIG